VFEELDVLHLGDRLLFGGGDIHKFLNGSSLQKVFFDKEWNVFNLELLVEDTLGVDHKDGAPLAETVAACGDDEDFLLEVSLPDLLLQSFFDLEGSAGNTSGAGAD
jgi:hypothetical protein